MTLLTRDVEPLWIARYDYEPNWRLPPHAHEDYYQLIFCVSGTGEALLGSERISFHAGHLFFIRPRLLHGLTAGKSVTVRTLDTKFRIQVPALRRALRSFASFQRTVDPAVVGLLEAILVEARAQGALTNEFCQTLLTQLLLRLLRHEPVSPRGPAPSVWPAPAESDLSGRIEQFLRGNSAGKIDQQVLSAALHYSYRHLHAVWQKRHGESPLRSLWSYRVERASHFIRYSDYELKRIAELTGFATVHHFTRVFSRLAGISPARWRERERRGVRQDIVIRPGFINRGITIQAQKPVSWSGKAKRGAGG